MSNALAIAAITAVFKNLLEDGLVQNTVLSSMGNVLVTTLPPDQISIGVDDQPRLNLFLYQVSQNRNADLGGRDSLQDSFASRNLAIHHQASTEEGTILPLAVNLHYILTAYGNKDFQTEILLGYVMQLMHQTPVLSNATIRATLNHVATINRSGVLAQAIASTSVEALTEQLDYVKIAPNLFDTEQMSRLWSLLHSSYRPSIAYEVSMVFAGAKKFSLPPGSSKGASNQPRIEKIVALDTNDKIIVGSSLIVYGKNLSGEITQICLNEGKLLLEPQIIEDNRLLFKLPQNLYAGVHHIKIVHQQMYKDQNNDEVVSNDKTFVLHPIIKITVQKQGFNNQDQSNQDNSETALTVQFHPKVGQQQQVILRLTSINELNREIYTFKAPSRNADDDTIQFLITNIPAGSYLVQSEVDGIESADINRTEDIVVIKAR